MSATIQAILDRFHAEYGFDPLKCYCLATGKPFGRFFDDEEDEILSLVSVANADADEAADDLSTRVLASMRPSLKWNKFRSQGIADLRKSHPVETMAYLLNRLFAPHNRLRGGITLRHLEERIRAYQHIESWPQGDAWNTLMYMLLELDAKWGLDTETPPFNWRDFFIDAPSQEARVEMVQNWYARRMDAWEKKLKAEELNTKWIRSGNAVAKPAFMDAFMESQPLTPTAIKKAEKQAEKNLFAGLLYEVMSGKEYGPLHVDETPEEKAAATKPNPVFVPVRKMPTKFGVK